MSVFTQIKSELRLWFELCEKKKTAAEVVVSEKIAVLHDGLAGLETKVGLVEVDVLKDVRAIVAAAKGEADVLVTKLDASIKTVEDAATALKAAFEAQQAKKSAVAAPAAPAVVETPAPASEASVAAAAPLAPVDESVTP